MNFVLVTDPGSFKLTDIWYRLRVSFVRWCFIRVSFVYTHWKHSNGHMGKVRGCAMLPDWTVLLIVLRENIINKCILSIIYSTEK